MKFYYSIIFFLVFQQVYAQGTCPAEANYQGCKQIEQDKLSKCSPVDYSCQCEAQKLIQQCFNLCPNYISEATIHDSVVQSICSAVPTPSTTIFSSTMPSSSTPSLINTSTSPSPSSNQPSYANTLMLPSFPFFFFSSLGFYLFINII